MMISPTGNKIHANNAKTPSQGFTLIELILVMAMLLTVISLASASLARFFRGRTLDSETRRFLALTRYAQSRAVSEGTPMILWINTQEGTYGLQADPTYIEKDAKAAEFKLDNNIQIQVQLPILKTITTTFSSLPNNSQKYNQTTPIRFTPDGFITESSPQRVFLREHQHDQTCIAQSRTRLNYEIQTNQFETIWR